MSLKVAVGPESAGAWLMLLWQLAGLMLCVAAPAGDFALTCSAAAELPNAWLQAVESAPCVTITISTSDEYDGVERQARSHAKPNGLFKIT